MLPQNVLKALVYGYLSNIYSSRKMDKILKVDICFIRFSTMSRNE
ncbi:transposase [Chryseobacterium aureum]